MKPNSIRPLTKSATALWLSLYCISLVPAPAANLYWDLTDSLAGAGGATPTGDWTTTGATWNATADGTGVLVPFVSTETAVFAAGTDATGSYTVTITGTQAVGGVTIEEGTVELTGGAASVTGAGVVTVGNGATLVTNSSLRIPIAAAAGATYVLDGGTLRTTNTGVNGSFIDGDAAIVLNAGGGTFSFNVTNVLNIIQNASISGVGSFTKTGPGVLAIPSAGTWQGTTTINDGELRIRTTANRLPITTAVTVTGPGILNLNGVSQQIGSLSGNGNVGTGSGTLTINGSDSTTFDGALKNIANAGASGVTTGNGRLVKSGTGVITFNGINDIAGSVTLNAGGITVNAGASLCGNIADVTVTGGTLTLNNVAQTIENLAGTGGTIVLGPGHTLTSDPVASTAYSGTIAGPGALTKLNVLSATNRTLTLSGNNTYDGITTISGGNIAVGSATALGSTVGHTDVASGAEALFTGAAVNFTIAEPFRIAGVGNTDSGAIAVIASATPTFSGPITLTGDATVAVSSTAAATFSNAASFTSLSNQSLTLQGGSGAGAGGTISGAIALGSGGLTKLQGGTWVLAGANTYTGATSIGAGILAIAGSITGTSGISVTGTLAGGGTITPASGGSINLLANGKLSPGLLGVGNLKATLSGGGKVDLSLGVTPTNSQALVFELGTGLSSDTVTITGGALDIGTGVLEFDDFNFSALAGFGDQTIYTLFSTNTSILGTLGANLTGTIGGFDAQIGFADGGTDLVVTVPEPGSATLLLASLGLLAIRRRR